MMAGRLVSRTAILRQGVLRVDDSYEYIYDEDMLLDGPVGVRMTLRAVYLNDKLVADSTRAYFLAEKADLVTPVLIRDFSEGRL